MTVRLYDTATRGLVELPQPPAEIGMYVCGPTVYQRAHIGNAVPFVLFAWLRNWLRERGYTVTRCPHRASSPSRAQSRADHP